MGEWSRQSDTDVPVTREEWRVTGEPGGLFPTYSFTYSEMNGPDPERRAKAFVAMINDGQHAPWKDGPHLFHRTVVVSPWEPA